MVLRFKVRKLIHIPENYEYNSIILRGFFNEDCIKSGRAELLSHVIFTVIFHGYQGKAAGACSWPLVPELRMSGAVPPLPTRLQGVHTNNCTLPFQLTDTLHCTCSNYRKISNR